MQHTLDFHATAADRTAYDALIAAAKECFPFTGEWYALQRSAADYLVSCYVASGEDGRAERVHETRRDGSCRCGENDPRFTHGDRASYTRDLDDLGPVTEIVVVDENHGDGTWTVRFEGSEDMVTVNGHLLHKIRTNA